MKARNVYRVKPDAHDGRVAFTREYDPERVEITLDDGGQIVIDGNVLSIRAAGDTMTHRAPLDEWRDAAWGYRGGMITERD